MGRFGGEEQIFYPESAVSEIALVSLVGLCAYEKVLKKFKISQFLGRTPYSQAEKSLQHNTDLSKKNWTFGKYFG